MYVRWFEPTRRHASPTSYAHQSRRLEVIGFAKSGSERSAGKEAQLTYIVNESCIRCKTMDCVEVCPVDCFYEGENMLVIHPDECIDCGVCEPECPVDAIKPDTEPGLEKYTRKSGQILRSKKRPHPTLRSGRGSRTNSNTSYQIQARVIEPDGTSAVWV